MKRRESSFILFSLIISIALCALKFAAYFLTHSLVILADALESIINIIAGGFAFYSIYLSAKPKDTAHPYGHGKIEFFSIGFEGGLIFLAGCTILYESVFHILHPIELKQLITGAWLIAVSTVVNFGLGYFLIQNGRRLNSLTLEGNGKHIISDGYSSFGVIAAIVLIYFTGYKIIDPIASIISGSIIIYSGFRLLRRSVSGLMDETDIKMVDELVKILAARRRDAWIDVHNMRVQRFGQTYHVDCHVTLPYYYTLTQVHEEVTKIDRIINEHFIHGNVEFFIHTDPCIEESCLHCLLADCPVRRNAFIRRIEWSKDNVLPNRKHHFPK